MEQISLLDGRLEGLLVEPDATHICGIQLRSGSDIFAVLNDATQSRRLAVELAQHNLLVLKAHVERSQEPTEVQTWAQLSTHEGGNGWHNPYKGRVDRPAGAGMHIAEMRPVIAAAEKFWIQHGMEERMKGHREHLGKDPNDQKMITPRMLLGAYILFEGMGMGKELTDAIIDDLPRLQTDIRERGDMTLLTKDVVHRLVAPADFKGIGFTAFHMDILGLHAMYRPHTSDAPLLISFPGAGDDQ